MTLKFINHANAPAPSTKEPPGPAYPSFPTPGKRESRAGMTEECLEHSAGPGCSESLCQAPWQRGLSLRGVILTFLSSGQGWPLRSIHPRPFQAGALKRSTQYLGLQQVNAPRSRIPSREEGPPVPVPSPTGPAGGITSANSSGTQQATFLSRSNATCRSTELSPALLLQVRTHWLRPEC